MKVIFTEHAKKRIRERNLSIKKVKTFIANPDSIEPSSKNSRRFLLKKLYFHPRFQKQHLFMAICEQEKEGLVIVTIIDTSKIKKYI